MPSALAEAVSNSPPDVAPLTELVSNWSAPFRRQPDREYEEINPAEAVMTASDPEPDPENVAVQAPTILEPDPEPEPEAAHDHAAAEPEGVTEMMTSDVKLEIASDLEVVAASALIEQSPESEAFSPSVADTRPVDLARQVEQMEAPAITVAAEEVAPADNPVKEVPVEDLLTGIFNVADSAVRGAIGASTDLLRNRKSLGGKLSVTGQSLVQSIKGRFNALLAPRHGAEGKGDEF
jgi:hypothetical protein